MAAPYKVSMDPEQARRLATTGVSLLLLDVPQGTLLGVDQQVQACARNRLWDAAGPSLSSVAATPPAADSLKCCTRQRRFAKQRSALLYMAPIPTPQVFVVGPRFKGLKMVPPGVHFLSYQATGRGNMAPAVSTFLVLNSREVVVRRWDAAQEGLAPFTDEDEVSGAGCGA